MSAHDESPQKHGEGESFSAIILAAGKGTRMLSAQPKVLHRILGRSMLGWVLSALREAACERGILVLGHGRAQIEAELAQRHSGLQLRVAHQREQKGTADAVRAALECAQPEDAEWFMIVYGDVPCMSASALERLFEARVAGGLAFLSMRVEDPTGYGRVIRDAEGQVLRIVEDRECSPEERLVNEVNSGIYCVEQSFLRRHLARVQAREGATRELYLTDLVELAVTQGAGAVALEDAQAETLMGVNDRVQLAEATAVLRRRLNRDWMRRGVSLEAPEHTQLEPEVELAEDVFIEAGAVLRGRCRVGRGARIGAHAVLQDCVVEEDAVVEPLTLHEGVRLRGLA
ncbi:MAG: NTP transferase domain-containing protein [Myxococcota bacterium]|jgi:bifunctional UDP-N-acetylglucosamine pyrophosphorylase/glucosamine-1-phosphate N-acetyltransferase|nr:NTP transferase domain-containing protein [Myxococcota bacterium]